jgi:hypothetical protein
MLTEAVRNAQRSADHRPKHSPKAEKIAARAADVD